ncbi:DUF4386 family protein [bacterium]|nr:DUF4386 family protein [bacterium]
MNKKTLYLSTGILLLVEAFLIFVPTIILGGAIDWPNNLDLPASVNLPLVISESTAVRSGYFVYLIYSVLFWPVALLTARVVAGSDQLPPLLRIAAGFGVISALARTIGIVRWLSAMPVLATLYVDGTPETQAVVSVVYDAVNAYGGTIGEALGVGLFAGMWMLLIAVAMLRSTEFPRWLGLFGLMAALAVTLQSTEMLGADLGGLIVVLVAVLHLWLMAAGGLFIVRGLRLPAGAAVLAEERR